MLRIGSSSTVPATVMRRTFSMRAASKMVGGCSCLPPGSDSYNMDLPWFHVTRYGSEVLKAELANPHDPTGYLRPFREGSAS